MTGPEDSHSGTRPISVAELLAKNGTIGAPPVGGRRRRRRGNSDAVTVAELTGEIPIVTDGALAETGQAPAVDEYVEVTGSLSSNGAPDPAEADTDLEASADVAEADPDVAEADPDVAEADTDLAEAETDYVDVETEHVDADTDEADTDEAETANAELETDYADAVADYTAHIEQRDHLEPLDFVPRARRPHYAHAARRYHPPAGGGAEQMSPDPVIDDEGEAVEAPVKLAESLETEDIETVTAAEAAGTDDADELPSYLRSSESPLFGGQTVADDLARRGAEAVPKMSTWMTSRTTSKPPGRRSRRCRRSCAGRGSSGSASLRWPLAPVCSSPSTSCGCGTTSSPWCCPSWSFSAWWSACGWYARPKTSAAR